MARVRLTEQAQNELDAIIEYYERIGAVDFAEVFEEKVIEKIRPLERFPRMGRVAPEINDKEISSCPVKVQHNPAPARVHTWCFGVGKLGIPGELSDILMRQRLQKRRPNTSLHLTAR